MSGQLGLIVEGHGEVAAAATLVRRLLQRENRYDIRVARPMRVKRHRVVKPGELERSLTQLRRARAVDAAVVLLDSDDDCPVQLAATLQSRADACVDIPVSVVFAHREFEAWFLAAKASLRGVCGIREAAMDVDDPEAIRDAKGRMTSNMDGARRYLEVIDQPSLSAAVDLDRAQERSRSFRKMCDEVRRLAEGM